MYVGPWYFGIHVLYVVIMHTSHLYVLLSVPYFLCINNDIKFHLFAFEFEDHVMNFKLLLLKCFWVSFNSPSLLPVRENIELLSYGYL